ncbi:MAG: methyltransferase domain-containing protein [Xanthobacteraceae bacterium]
MQITKLVSLVAGSLVALKLGIAPGPPVRAEEFLAFRSETRVSSAFAGGQTFHVKDAKAAGDYTYLAPPGAGPGAFPRPQRPVAPVVSPSRASEEERDANDEAGQLARLMGFKPGMTIADIGAGSGYHTVRLSRLLGHSGLVIAQDVSRKYLGDLAARIKQLDLRNVNLALGEPHDPRLPAGSLDAAVLVHMYHEIAEPYAFLYNLAPALKPAALVGIVDLVEPTPHHGTPPDLLRCELAAVGYREVGFFKLSNDTGYLAVFSAPSAANRPNPAAIKPCALTNN